MEQATQTAAPTNAAIRKLHSQISCLSTGQNGFEDALYYYNAKLKEYRIRGRKVNAFVYAHSAFKISEIAEMSFTDEHGRLHQMQGVVMNAVGKVLGYFAQKFASADVNKVQIAVNEVIHKHGKHLSIFGLIHCLELVEMRAEPMSDITMYGFDITALNQAFFRYRNWCKSQYDTFLFECDQAEEDKSSLAANMAGLARSLDNAPAHVKESWNKLKERNDERAKKMKGIPERLDVPLEDSVMDLIRKGILTPGDPQPGEFD